MPKKTQLSETEAFTAIEAILLGGGYPTAARLRENLDGRGSPVVLQRFLASWYETNGPEIARKAEQAKHGQPTKQLKDELQRLTRDAISEIDKARADQEAELTARQTAMDQREQTLLAKERQLANRESDHAAWIEDLRQREKRSAQQADEAASRLTEATSKLKQAQATITDLESKLPILERTQADLTAATCREASLTGVMATLEKDLAQAQEKLASEQALSATLLEERGKLSGELHSSQKLSEELKATLATTRNQNQSLSDALQVANDNASRTTNLLAIEIDARNQAEELASAAHRSEREANMRLSALQTRIEANDQAERSFQPLLRQMEGLTTAFHNLEGKMKILQGQEPATGGKAKRKSP